MTRVVASLAAALAVVAIGCGGGGGAEPGASAEATLILDFTPNAVHAGIYAALAEGDYREAGIEVDVRAPGESTDAPRLLAAGRADFAVLTINDLAIARERGVDLVALMPIVRVPLGAVIAADRKEVRRPADLEGRDVGVTGLPSDDAVLDAVMRADGGDPAAVARVNTGFDSVAALTAGQVAAATAFWNAEGVALRELGVPTREFRVAELTGAVFPELVLATTREMLESDESVADAFARATQAGTGRVARAPGVGVRALTTSVKGIDPEAVAAQLDALIAERAFALEPDRFRGLAAWERFATEGGIVSRRSARETVRDAFRPPGAR